VPDADTLPVIEDLFQLVQKNVRGIHEGVYYRTNSRGLRGPEYSRVPAKGTFRILIAGDSVTMGSGVLEQDAYSAVLERLLNAEGGPARSDGVRRYEVLNLGVSGINATWAITRLTRLGDTFHADLVVYGFTINDIQGPHYEQRVEPERAESMAVVWKRVQRVRNSPSHLVRELWPRLMMIVEWDAFHAGPGGTFGTESDVWQRNYFENPPAWRDLADALEKLARYAEDRGICGEVFIHTYLAQLDDEHPFDVFYQRVGDEALSLGLGVTQSLPAFVGRDPSSLWVDRFDSHPNEAGHEILARALLEGLRSLPPACWRIRDERARVARAHAKSLGLPD
jgi:lysophospholipase L1-like esterase